MGKISRRSKLRCAFCRGRGIQPGAGRLSCIVCKGSGRITVKAPYSICKECGGRGKKEGANLYCLLCQGRGFVEESSPTGDHPKGDRYPLAVESSVSKTRRKRSKKSAKPKVKKVPTRTAGRVPIAERSRIRDHTGTKVEVKKGIKSFFKELLTTLKIL